MLERKRFGQSGFRLGNAALLAGNLALMLVLFWYIAMHGISDPPAGWDYKDLIAIILTSIGVILAALAIFIGILAIWGYTTIKEAAVEAGRKAGESAAQSRLAPFVLREKAGADLIAAGPSEDRTDDLTSALAEKDGENGR